MSTWRKSSHSNPDGGACIEVNDANPGCVRDSKDPSGPFLAFPSTAWQAFVHATSTGEFNR
ncbi:DUF397 domain-containing protein [Kitasatospora sp. GAS204B]|uniref:DUF397 domain-containing protein n=1 Tax=unclassified Kitasatospora TaxID=2633591 RepID=UPI002474BCC8|nr:DUF397 domain-containing protein [Kitasatospora sp. GAS204B]MDH6122084.1 hypothetical protein [Kitasatospora sp. GAS204B]